MSAKHAEPTIVEDARRNSLNRGEKPTLTQNEFLVDEEGKAAEQIDYSGAHEKTDLKEIRLVKKLDLWIMPTLWLMVRDCAVSATYLS